MTNSRTENEVSVISLEEVRKKVEEQQKEQELLNMSSEELQTLNTQMLIQLVGQLIDTAAKTQETLYEVSMTYGKAIRQLQEQVNELRELVIHEEE